MTTGAVARTVAGRPERRLRGVTLPPSPSPPAPPPVVLVVGPPLVLLASDVVLAPPPPEAISSWRGLSDRRPFATAVHAAAKKRPTPAHV